MMKRVLILGTIVLGLDAMHILPQWTPRPVVMEPQKEAYPGQREHKAPPKGWYCARPAKHVPKAHQCNCKRMCSKNEDGTLTEQEDQKCAVFCHKNSCTCPTSCSQT